MTYQLQAETSLGDLSGSLIESDRDVAVFGRVSCANVPIGIAACDHIEEQLFPTSTWGTSFVSVSLAIRFGGDVVRYKAKVAGSSPAAPTDGSGCCPRRPRDRRGRGPWTGEGNRPGASWSGGFAP
jgi:hypothetical protein